LFLPGTSFTVDTGHMVYTLRHIVPNKRGTYALEGNVCYG
jgi:hypothetical protein